MRPHRTQWLIEWFDESEDYVNHKGLASNCLFNLNRND